MPSVSAAMRATRQQQMSSSHCSLNILPLSQRLLLWPKMGGHGGGARGEEALERSVAWAAGPGWASHHRISATSWARGVGWERGQGGPAGATAAGCQALALHPLAWMGLQAAVALRLLEAVGRAPVPSWTGGRHHSHTLTVGAAFPAPPHWMGGSRRMRGLSGSMAVVSGERERRGWGWGWGTKRRAAAACRCLVCLG